MSGTEQAIWISSKISQEEITAELIDMGGKYDEEEDLYPYTIPPPVEFEFKYFENKDLVGFGLAVEESYKKQDVEFNVKFESAFGYFPKAYLDLSLISTRDRNTMDILSLHFARKYS